MSLQNITDLINKILSPGPAVFMPLIILFFVFIIKVFNKKAITWYEGIRSAVLLGIAFIAMGTIIGFMFNAFIVPFQKLGEIRSFNTLDLGWAPMAGLSWAWPYAFLMFPIQILTNVVMLNMKKTKTLNADLWNVWNKVFTALLVTFVATPALGSKRAVVAGLFVGFIQVIFELKNADALYERQFQTTGIPNIVTPHSMFLIAPILHYIDKFLQKLPYFKGEGKQQVSSSVWTKVLRENMFTGFIIGALISLIVFWIDRGNWQTYLRLPFQLGTALVLFPMAAKLFTESLVPVGAAVQQITQERYKDREIYIGLDWPFLAGNPKLWIVGTMLTPFIIIYSFILSYIPGFNALFPLGAIINVCLAAPLLVVCRQNLRRMFTTGLIAAPLFLIFGSYAAPAMTELAVANKSVLSAVDASTIAKLGTELFITQSGFEAPVFRFVVSATTTILGGFSTAGLVGTGGLIIWLFVFLMYYKETKEEAAKLKSQRLNKVSK